MGGIVLRRAGSSGRTAAAAAPTSPRWLLGCLAAAASVRCPPSSHTPAPPTCPSASSPRRAKGSWQIGAVVKPLGSAFIGAFKVHQFCGGFNLRCAALFDTLHERTLHYSRMMDPAWFRSSKVAT